MTIGDFEINALATAPIIDLSVVSTPWCAAGNETRVLDLMKNGVEFRVGDVERVVVALEIGTVIEEEGQRVIDFDRREMLAGAFVGKAEELREVSAAASLSYAGTMVWLSVIAIIASSGFISPLCAGCDFRPTLR